MDELNNADVEELTTVANKFYDEAQAATVGMLESAWKSGQALFKIKAKMKHGEWMPWVEANFHGSYQTANAYMTLASKFQTSRDLAQYTSVDAALKAIRAENTKKKPKREPKPAPLADNPVVEATIRDLEDKGEKYSAPDVVDKCAAEGVQVSPDTVERKRKAIRAELSAPPVAYDSLPGKVAEKWDRCETTIRKKLEREFRTRLLFEAAQHKAKCDAALDEHKAALDAEYKRLYDVRKEDYRRFREMVEAQRANGLMSLRDYNTILSCLHPDSRVSVSNEKLAAAFRLFNDPKVKMLLARETDG
jgi:hypothetical protein